MRILVIGNANGKWVKEFADRVLSRHHCVEVVSVDNSIYSDWYKEKHIGVVELRHPASRFAKIRGLRTAKSLIMLHKYVNASSADLIVCIYSNWMIQLSLMGVKNSSRIIFWYIGSDLLRTSRILLQIVKRSVFNTRNVIVINEEMMIYFKKVYPSYKGSIYQVDFGYSHLEYIDNNIETSYECQKAIFGKNFIHKTVVAIGYNASKAQQADAVLREMCCLPDKIKHTLFCVIPMQYGGDDANYIKRVKETIEKSGIECVILSDYYDGYKMASYVKAVDIFINSQITDAMSAALVEHLYSGTIVLNASWLKYSKLEKMNLFYLNYDKFSDLNEILLQVLNSLSEYKNIAMKNHNMMGDEFSWKKCRDSFEALSQQYKCNNN